MKMAIPMHLTNKEEVFCHRDDDGTYRHFPTGFMFKFAMEYAGKCDDILGVTVKLLPAVAAHIRKNMGIEPERIDRLRAPYLEMPLIGILWEDAKLEMTIVDGNHRYLKLFDSGVTEARVFVFKRCLWEQMLLPLPADESCLSGDSGMLRLERKRA